MKLARSISDNLSFLTSELSSQVSLLKAFFSDPASSSAQQLVARSDFVYSLRARILENCQIQVANHKHSDTELSILRTMESVATELSRINELCLECLNHKPAHDSDAIRYFSRSLNRLKWGLDMIDRAIAENDTQIALKIGDTESKLEKTYRKMMRQYIDALRNTRKTEHIISVLFVAHNIDQMGDAMLSISEALISANLGKSITTVQYHALKASVNQLKIAEPESLDVRSLAETRSGSAISALLDPTHKNKPFVGVFKHGKKRKLKEERQGVEAWHKLYPGLAPRILSHHKQGKSAALLIEHLAGLTFEQIILNESDTLLAESLQALTNTLQSVWDETRNKKPVPAHFMQQLQDRLPAVYAIHPEFARGGMNICGVEIASFEQLIESALLLEKKLEPPFSVYIHGDFNNDNIIYDAVEKRINFIDLHRSCYMDYVQDISVFMVSNYRMQILDHSSRQRIMQLTQAFYRYAGQYARKAGDTGFDSRLALGLARSFASSTRFILDKTLARRMFLRARYLLQCVLATPAKQQRQFKLPVEEIFID